MNQVTKLQPPAQDLLINYEAEQAFLGAVLANNEVWHRVADRLMPEHFADAVHGRIYEAAGGLISQGRIANVLTLKAIFDQDGGLVEAGGARYLVELAQNVVTVLNAEDFAEVVIDLFRRREMIKAAEVAIAEARLFAPADNALQVIERLETRIADIASKTAEARPAVTVGQAMTAAIQDAEDAMKAGKAPGIVTGLRDLDKELGGLHNGDLIILAGRPSMGKTALATTMIRGLAEESVTRAIREQSAAPAAAFFSLEMGAKELGQRFVAMETGISAADQRSGQIGDVAFDLMLTAAGKFAQSPIIIDDDPQVTVAAIHSRARRIQRAKGLSVVVIDYLQLIKPPAGRRGDVSRNEVVGELSAACKAMAKKLFIPVVLLCQLSRAVEGREDKRPQLSDLRDSGSIEQDADAVMFVYREQYYLERSEPTQMAGEDDAKFSKRLQTWNSRLDKVRGTADVIIAKNRHGPAPRTARMMFDGPKGEFKDLQWGLYD